MSDFDFGDFGDVSDLAAGFQRAGQAKQLANINQNLEEQTEVLRETQRLAQQQALYQRLQLKAKQQESQRLQRKEKKAKTSRSQVAELDLFLRKCKLDHANQSSTSILLLDAAILQLAVSRLEEVKKDLPEMQDLQAYNELVVQIAEYIQTLSKVHNVPANPLEFFKNVLEPVALRTEEVNLQLQKAIEYGEALCFETAEPSITAVKICSWQNGLSVHEQNCEALLTNLRGDLVSTHHWNFRSKSISSTTSLPAIVVYAETASHSEKLAHVIEHLGLVVNLDRILNTALASHSRGVLFTALKSTLQQARNNLKQHNEYINKHHKELRKIELLATEFKTESAMNRFNELTRNGEYGDVPYSDCSLLIQKQRKPILEIESRAEEAKKRLKQCMYSARKLKAKSFFSNEITSFWDSLESVETDIKAIKKQRKIPTKLLGSELADALKKSQAVLAKSLESELSVIELQYQRRKRAAISTFLVWGSLTVVIVALALGGLTLL